jgi:hypothetical protein
VARLVLWLAERRALRYNFGPRSEQLNKNKQRGDPKQRVDERSETLHNLASLLLTNTTIRNAASKQAVPNTFFNNKQSISVGV